MAELVDAVDSKSTVRKDMGVRVSPEAPLAEEEPGLDLSKVDDYIALMSEPLKPSTPKKRPTNLELADQMWFKDAFLVKKTRFSHLHPHLSDKELHKMTAEYFRKLNEEKSR